MTPERRDEVRERIVESHRQRKLERERKIADGLRACVIEVKDLGRRVVDLAERIAALREEWERRDESTIAVPILPPNPATAETERIQRPTDR